MSYDILVIGAGPAGLSAALQARVRGKSVLVVAGDDRDNALYKAHQVDNYLGLPGLTGPALSLAAISRSWHPAGSASGTPQYPARPHIHSQSRAAILSRCAFQAAE